MTLCYIGLGGNFDQTLSVMRKTVKKLAALNGISQLKSSSVYRTTPVSDIPQPHFLNAVCRFSCQLSLLNLWKNLQKIEVEMGKASKLKNAPRLIDIDLLFYGSTIFYSNSLTVPHPKWHERLFVLAPLAEITNTIPLDINIEEMLQKFLNPYNEQVELCVPLT